MRFVVKSPEQCTKVKEVNPGTSVLPLVLVPLPGYPQLDDLFLAVDGSDEDARIIAVLVPIGILHEDKGPFPLVPLFPLQSNSREIVPKMETDNHATVSLKRGPKYFLHKLRARIERETGRE